MYRKWMILLSILLLMGGCSFMNMGNQNSGEKKEEEYSLEDDYVPVQEYTGDEFELKGANPKTGEIAEANRDEVEEAVKDYFLKHYKTEVKINNIVSAKDGVSVFVESLGNIEFYAMAIVPIDVQNDKVETDHVWSLEGYIEGAITSGLYVEAFREEFDKLDEVLNRVVDEHDLIGIKQEVVEKTKGDGYENTYYFVTSTFEFLYELYMENPNISQQELRNRAINFLNDHDYNLSNFNGISIRFYLDEPGLEPSGDLIHEIYETIEAEENLPGGRYSILLNDNNIDVLNAHGEKDSTKRSVFHLEGEL